MKHFTERKKPPKLSKKKNYKIKQKPLKLKQKLKNILNQEPKIGALNPNSVLCNYQAPLLAFSALNPGSALNPRTLNPGTTVFT